MERSTTEQLRRPPVTGADVDAAMADAVERVIGAFDAVPAATGLPSAPTKWEKYTYLRDRGGAMWAVMLIGSAAIVASFVHFGLTHAAMVPFVGVGVVAGVYGSVSLLTSGHRRAVTVGSHRRLVAAYRPAVVPSVDVFLPTAGESIEVIRNTYSHVAQLRHDGELRVYALDDAGREEVRVAAAEFGFTYLARPDRGAMKKAGNLRYGYERSSGDFIAVFDADFAPRADFIPSLLPYAGDPRVGIVQSAQYFDSTRDMNWLQRFAGSTQETFYRLIQGSRDAVGAPICVGTNALYRRDALRRAGGFAQIGHSEDVHTGVNLMKVGYRVRYVPLILARGLCPDELDSFAAQQYRWCSGSMLLMRDRSFYRDAAMGLRQRLCFFSGFLYYLCSTMLLFTNQLPAILRSWCYPGQASLGALAWMLPGLFVSVALTPMTFRSMWSVRGQRVQVIAAAAHFVALVDTFRGRTAAWVPTGAARRNPVGARVRRLLVAWIGLTQVAAWSGLVYDCLRYPAGRYLPFVAVTVLWSVVYLPIVLPIREGRFRSVVTPVWH